MLVLSSLILLLLLPLCLLSSTGLVHQSYRSLLQITKNALTRAVGPPAVNSIFRRDLESNGVAAYFTTEVQVSGGTISLMIPDRVDTLDVHFCVTDPDINDIYLNGDFATLEKCRPGDPTQSWQTIGQGNRHPGWVSFNTLMYSGYIRNEKTGRCLWADAVPFDQPGDVTDDRVGMQALGFLTVQDCRKGIPKPVQFRFDPLDTSDDNSFLERIYPKSPNGLAPMGYATQDPADEWNHYYRCPDSSLQTLAIPRLFNLTALNITFSPAIWGCRSSTLSGVETAFAGMNPSPLQNLADILAEQAKVQPSLTSLYTPSPTPECISKRSLERLQAEYELKKREYEIWKRDYNWTFWAQCDQARKDVNQKAIIDLGCSQMPWPVDPPPPPPPQPSC
ncbi:hypothetical protein TWF696_007806 [Orbilia brochopaga]|uniref:Uncharacterized protein n=1 Tax=Orbilia brochopaga TaxID=3140254 RepID=A0AAV9UM03_9PEZI